MIGDGAILDSALAFHQALRTRRFGEAKKAMIAMRQLITEGRHHSHDPASSHVAYAVVALMERLFSQHVPKGPPRAPTARPVTGEPPAEGPAQEDSAPAASGNS